MSMEDVKYCSTCDKTKSKKEFSKHRAKCISCRTIQAKEWRHANSEKHNEYQAKYKSNKYHTNVNFKITAVLRSRLRKVIKNNWKVGSAVALLGCTTDEFKAHIESKWQPGMTWDNWSIDGWHIDHIVPLDSFDLQNIEELQIACHYSNLQPLWSKDNCSKSNKVE